MANLSLTDLRSFFLHPLIEALQSYDHALVRTLADGLDRIDGGNAKSEQAPVDLDQLGFGAHAHAHRRRGRAFEADTQFGSVTHAVLLYRTADANRCKPEHP